jgi:hypothetical protein
MKTKLATVLLSVAFLSAGAFANGKLPLPAIHHSTQNQTVVVKNQFWPIKEMMTVEPCQVARCVSI